MTIERQVATYVVHGRTRQHDVARTQRKIEQQPRALNAIELHQLSRAFSPTWNELPAVAARSAPPDAPRLKQNYGEPRFSRCQRRVQARIAAADDNDVRLRLSLKF